MMGNRGYVKMGAISVTARRGILSNMSGLVVIDMTSGVYILVIGVYLGPRPKKQKHGVLLGFGAG